MQSYKIEDYKLRFLNRNARISGKLLQLLIHYEQFEYLESLKDRLTKDRMREF